ncbi:DUF5107 domain-containing protein [Ruminiclostridium cellobioparum]|jgi:galactose mutarotase-like enzyme|uniref:DUF5107 domain-containing protein n=1 Tax=Ruminiclostridium cellobioparum TaxID=29355 RepID=UPI0028ADADF0|nr:DUF5107 domain-containing protein [Ruminiclostridium cellobioparum]
MIYESIFKGTKSIVIESEKLKVIVLPELGGKLASIFNKPKEFELLFQNKADTYKKAGIYEDFGNYDASGFDDAFPSINEGMVPVGGELIKYPDHGEIWTMAFSSEITGEKLVLHGVSSILSYEYKKILSVQGDQLLIRYIIDNTGTADIPCLWAMHCLIRCEEDMELIFPEGTKEIRNVYKSKYLGEVDRIHPYPSVLMEDGSEFRLDRIFPENAGKCEKYYVNGRVDTGMCGAYYPGRDVAYRVYFHKERLPYLGFWLTEGGFRGDYNCALEPANGFYDSIATARKNNAVYNLKAGEAFTFDLKIELK